MKKLIFLLFLFPFVSSFSQCISGDCKDGFGKYDYGFAVYEGNFKSDKPNGKGTMDYGDGEKFIGNFKNGAEDGEGILYKKNVPKQVTYTNGKMKVKVEQFIIGGNTPKVEGCVVGDCYNGYGQINFSSGNSIKGEFLSGERNGSSLYTFKSGNTLKGNFKNNVLIDGVFTYANEGTTFTGTFDENTEPKTGKYYYANNKATVEVVNGKISKVDNPVARRADSLAVEQKKGKMCLKCGGKGFCGGEARAVTTESYYSINYVRSDGNIAHTSSGNVMRSTRMVASPISECSACRGKGKVYGQGGMIINSGRY
jgi:hypothetical protein